MALKLQIWDLEKLDVLREVQEQVLPLLQTTLDDLGERELTAVASELYDSPKIMSKMLRSHFDEDKSGAIDVGLLTRQAADTMDRLARFYDTAKKANVNKKVAKL